MRAGPDCHFLLDLSPWLGRRFPYLTASPAASRFTLFADGGSNPCLTLEVVFTYPLCLSVQAFNDDERAMELAEVS
jgi:hypothetical protein